MTRYIVHPEVNGKYSVQDTQVAGDSPLHNASYKEATALAECLNRAHEARRGRELLPGLELDVYQSYNTGEYHYRICDKVGLVCDSIYPNNLDKYFK